MIEIDVGEELQSTVEGKENEKGEVLLVVISSQEHCLFISTVLFRRTTTSFKQVRRRQLEK